MATFWPSRNPASFRPCSNAAARCSEPAAVELRRNPITGTADFCARAASGHATTVPQKSLMNSRRLMASPAPRTKSGIKRLSHFWTENYSVRRTEPGPQPCPLCAKSGHWAIGARPCVGSVILLHFRCLVYAFSGCRVHPQVTRPVLAVAVGVVNMRGDPKVIENLNEGLRSELTAMNQYWLHYRLLDNWGYKTLAKKWHEESIEEMQHADKLIARIIFLDGMPNMQVLDHCASVRL